MGQYEPDDSRNVTLKPSATPGEPERTGPREEETHKPKAETDHQAEQRNSHEPKGTDLPRGSETSTGAASRHRS